MSISSTASRARPRRHSSGRSTMFSLWLPIEKGFQLDADDVRRRTLIMRLMCDRRLDFAALSRELGVDVRVAYAAEIARLEPLEADGLLHVTASGVEVTPAGVPLLRVAA